MDDIYMEKVFESHLGAPVVAMGGWEISEAGGPSVPLTTFEPKAFKDLRQKFWTPPSAR